MSKIGYGGKPGEVGVRGSVSALSVGHGDTKFSFDKSNPAERIRAARIIRDMLRRGYALLVEVERDGVKTFERALDFDPETCEYVIADLDPEIAAKADAEEDHSGHEQGESKEGGSAPGKATEPAKRQYTKRRVEADGTRAVAVARTAGG